jgi:hypothetical protein
MRILHVIDRAVMNLRLAQIITPVVGGSQTVPQKYHTVGLSNPYVEFRA